MKQLDPISIRDFSRGRIAKSAVGPALAPQNSVAGVVNVDFSEIIGSARVRKGNNKQVTLVYASTTGQGQTGDNNSRLIYDSNFLAQTFTLAAGPTSPIQIGFDLKLKKTGSPAGALRIRIVEAPGGVLPDFNFMGPPLYDFSFPAASVSSSAGGTVYTFVTAPLILTAGQVYAIALSSAASANAGNSFSWFDNTASAYAGGEASSSSNNGGSWTPTAAGDDFYFQMYINNIAGTYNEIPLGNFSAAISATPFSVVVFQSKVNSLGVIYYYDSGAPGGATWLASDSQSLQATAKNRFALLKGFIFRANGVNAMTSSSDLGKHWTTADSITTDSVIPSLLWVSKNRMLASGYSGFPSRVYFSSIVDPNASTFITWNTDPDTGDWIDINPDDGGIVTGFSDTSNLVLIFKTKAMYRLNTISKTVDSENIFNVGAVSQEAIIKCLGLTYFYSGNGIYRTDGGFPELISRIGVQDFIDAISLQDLNAVYAGTDGFNVYFSIGDISLTQPNGTSRTFNRVVLKFSPRDESWQVFTYSKHLGQFTQSPLLLPDQIFSAQYNGDLGVINSSTNDYNNEIPYELETQELELGSRADTKIISDKVVIYTRQGAAGTFAIRPDDNDYVPVPVSLNDRVNVANIVNTEGVFFTFKWAGAVKGFRPVLEGFLLPVVTNQGITKGH